MLEMFQLYQALQRKLWGVVFSNDEVPGRHEICMCHVFASQRDKSCMLAQFTSSMAVAAKDIIGIVNGRIFPVCTHRQIMTGSLHSLDVASAVLVVT